METGLIERVTPEPEARRAPPGIPYRSPRAEPAAGQPPFTALPPSLAPVARGLAALAPFGYDARRRQRFFDAHALGCCYQCHAPFQNVLNDCPCPHWFITSASSVARVAPVFAMYAVGDVLHFIFLSLMAEHALRSPMRPLLTASLDDTAAALTLRIARKQWTFSVTHAHDRPTLTVALFNPRTGKTAALDIAVTERDVDVMLALAGAVAR